MIVESDIEDLKKQIGELAPEEIDFLYNLDELRKIASILKIPGRSKMNKIQLCLNIFDNLDQ